MRFFWIFLILIFVLSISFVDAIDKNINITSISISFYKTDATFTVKYDIGNFPRFYIIIFGSKFLKPEIDGIFSNFNYEIVKMDEYSATLRIKNISRYDNGYYFYDSDAKFGQGIPEVDIYLPGSSEPKKYSNLYLFSWNDIDNYSTYNIANFLSRDLGIIWKGDLKIFKSIDNKSIIGVVNIDGRREKLFLITLDKYARTSSLDVRGEVYNLEVMGNNDQFYIFSPYIYSIPNLFYK